MVGLSPLSPVICKSTDHPELGYHMLACDPNISGIPRWEMLKCLVFHLRAMLKTEECIIIFFLNDEDADRFTRQTGCVTYHGKLPTHGNCKAYYLNFWFRDEANVMATTTTFQQRIDYPWVAYIIYYEHTFSLINYYQGAGHRGQRACFAYVIVLYDKSMHHYHTWNKLGIIGNTHCLFAFIQIIRSGALCTRLKILETIDSAKLAISYKDSKACNSCDVCEPLSVMAEFLRKAINIAISSPIQHLADKSPMPTSKLISEFLSSSELLSGFFSMHHFTPTFHILTMATLLIITLIQKVEPLTDKNWYKWKSQVIMVFYSDGNTKFV
jgi:hypothetical protein